MFKQRSVKEKIKHKKSWLSVTLKKNKLFKKTIKRMDIAKIIFAKFDKAVPLTHICDVIDVLIDVIIDRLAEEQPVEIKNFGTFTIMFNVYENLCSNKKNDKKYNKILFYPSQTVIDLMKTMEKRNKLSDSDELEVWSKKVKS